MFVWPATQLLGFRFVVLLGVFLLLPFVLFAAELFSDLLLWLEALFSDVPMSGSQQYVWTAFGILLFTDLTVCGLEVWLHRHHVSEPFAQPPLPP